MKFLSRLLGWTSRLEAKARFENAVAEHSTLHEAMMCQACELQGSLQEKNAVDEQSKKRVTGLLKENDLRTVQKGSCQLPSVGA